MMKHDDPGVLVLPQQVVDLSVPVRGVDLDMESYEAKFAVWDEVVENNYLTSRNYGIQYKALRLLNDDTLYAYAYLKDDEGEPFRYTAYQDLIGQLKHDFTADCPNRYIVFKASNQIGKSRWLIGKAIKIVMTEENRNIVMVSKSLPQSQFLLASIKHVLNNSAFAETWKEDLGDTKNTTILTFQRTETDKDGSIIKTIVNRIICAPAGEGLLGYPVHYLFLDEADFYEEAQNFFWKIAFPRTKKTKGQIIVFSNPNTDIPRSQSLLWELWTGDLFSRKFSFNFLDAPWNTQEEFDRDRRNSPEHIFMSTHMGEFSEEAGAYLTHSEIRDMLMKEWNNVLPAATGEVYCALDLGKMNDQTVISVGIPKTAKNELDVYHDLDVSYQEALPIGTTYDKILDRMQAIKDHYALIDVHVVFGHDATGQKTFGDFLKRKGLESQEVDFSRKESNKTLLRNDFKLLVEKRKLKVVYSQKCEKQLANLMFKETEHKKLVKVENKSVTIHDDYFDSILILVHLAVKPHVVPVTATITSAAKEKAPDTRELLIEKTIRENNMKSYGRRFNPYG